MLSNCTNYPSIHTLESAYLDQKFTMYKCQVTSCLSAGRKTSFVTTDYLAKVLHAKRSVSGNYHKSQHQFGILCRWMNCNDSPYEYKTQLRSQQHVGCQITVNLLVLLFLFALTHRPKGCQISTRNNKNPSKTALDFWKDTTTAHISLPLKLKCLCLKTARRQSI